MSSYMKDARWRMGRILADLDGEDFYKLVYEDRQSYLDRAQEALDTMQLATIEALAKDNAND